MDRRSIGAEVIFTVNSRRRAAADRDGSAAAAAWHAPGEFVATCMGLPHRNREPGFPGPVQLAETRVAAALGMALDAERGENPDIYARVHPKAATLPTFPPTPPGRELAHLQ
jgi:hypothetical protein